MPSEARINIILPEEDQAIADSLAEELGLGSRSAAIRYALRIAAKKHGLDKSTKPLKKEPRRA